MQRDGVGIRKNWNMDLLPRDVWDDFNAAQRNIQAEVECVVQENQRLQFNWGLPHRMNIFSKAKEEHERKMMIQNKVFHQKMQLRQQQYQQQQQQQQYQQNKNNKSAPSAKTFGNGLSTGFFNNKNNNNNNINKDNNNNNKRLTKREKQELKKQKKQMKNNLNSATTMQNNIENPTGNNQQTQVRRRKPKHRFKNT